MDRPVLDEAKKSSPSNHQDAAKTNNGSNRLKLVDYSTTRAETRGKTPIRRRASISSLRDCEFVQELHRGKPFFVEPRAVMKQHSDTNRYCNNSNGGTKKNKQIDDVTLGDTSSGGNHIRRRNSNSGAPVVSYFPVLASSRSQTRTMQRAKLANNNMSKICEPESGDESTVCSSNTTNANTANADVVVATTTSSSSRMKKKKLIQFHMKRVQPVSISGSEQAWQQHQKGREQETTSAERFARSITNLLDGADGADRNENSSHNADNNDRVKDDYASDTGSTCSFSLSTEMIDRSSSTTNTINGMDSSATTTEMEAARTSLRSKQQTRLDTSTIFERSMETSIAEPSVVDNTTTNEKHNEQQKQPPPLITTITANEDNTPLPTRSRTPSADSRNFRSEENVFRNTKIPQSLTPTATATAASPATEQQRPIRRMGSSFRNITQGKLEQKNQDQQQKRFDRQSMLTRSSSLRLRSQKSSIGVTTKNTESNNTGVSATITSPPSSNRIAPPHQNPNSIESKCLQRVAAAAAAATVCLDDKSSIHTFRSFDRHRMSPNRGSSARSIRDLHGSMNNISTGRFGGLGRTRSSSLRNLMDDSSSREHFHKGCSKRNLMSDSTRSLGTILKQASERKLRDATIEMNNDSVSRLNMMRQNSGRLLMTEGSMKDLMRDVSQNALSDSRHGRPMLDKSTKSDHNLSPCGRRLKRPTSALASSTRNCSSMRNLMNSSATGSIPRTTLIRNNSRPWMSSSVHNFQNQNNNSSSIGSSRRFRRGNMAKSHSERFAKRGSYASPISMDSAPLPSKSGNLKTSKDCDDDRLERVLLGRTISFRSNSKRNLLAGTIQDNSAQSLRPE